MNTVYQLIISYGEWDSADERIVYADIDIEEVRAIRNEIKRRAGEIAVTNMREGTYNFEDLYGWVALQMENGVYARIDSLPLGGNANTLYVERVEGESWHLDMFVDMSEEPWQPADEMSRYETMAEPWEQRFLG